MGELKSLEQARVYSNNINNVDANNMPQNEQNLAIRYALHDIGKKTGEAPEYNFEYSPIDYSETLSSEIYKPYVNPLTDALGMLWNAVPSVGAAFGSFPTEMSSAGISLLNDALERITGDDYDDPKVQEAKKNWFYDPAAKGSIEWTNAVNDFFDSWKYKPSDKASEEIKVEDFWKTANPNNVAANIGNGVGSVLGFLGSIALTKGMSGSSTKLLGGFKGLSKANVLGSYIYMNNEINQEMTKNGLDPLTSAKLSSLISLPVALSEYIGLSALGNVISKPAMKKAIKGGLEDAVKTYGKTGLTKEMYQDFTAKSIQGITNRLTTVALKSGQGAAIEAVEETVQGKIQQAGEAIYDKIANEEVFGTKLFNEKALKEDLNNAFWGGAIGGLLGMGGGMINSKEMEESMFHYIGINVQKNRPAKIEGIKKFLTQLEQNGKITPEEAKQGVEMVDKMVKIHQEEMPVTLTDINARYQAYDLINKRNDVQAQLTSLDEKPIDNTLSTADNEIKKILEDKIEIYDKAVSLIAKTKGQVSEVGVQEAIKLVENQFTKIEENNEKIQEEEIENVEENDVLNTPVQEQAEGKTEEVVAPPVPVIKEERTKEVIEGDIARYENTIKNTDKEIEKLRKSKLRKDETQELRDAKIANLEQKKILLENKINEFSAEIGSQEAGVEETENIGEAVEAGDTGVSGEVESVGKIISSFDSNVAALVDKEKGIGAVVRKIVEEQKPFKLRFLQKRGLTIEEYNELGESEKDEIQNAWVNSDEFKALETQQTKTKQDATKITSPESVDVGEQTRNGEEMGEGNAQEKIAETGEEEKVRTTKRQQKPESAEVQRLRQDVEDLNRNLRNAKSRAEAGRIRKQISQKNKMIVAAKKGIPFTEKPKLKRVGTVGVPNFIRNFEPSSPRDKVLHYFVSGGRVSRQSIEDSLGLFKTELVDGVRKVIKGKEEFKALLPMFSEKAPHYTDIANELSDYEGGAEYDEMLSIFEDVMGQGKGAAIAELKENIEKMNNAGNRPMTDDELVADYFNALADEQSEYEAFTESEAIMLNESPEVLEAVDITLDNLTQPQRAKLEALVNKYTVDGVTDYESILTQAKEVFGADEDILALDAELNYNLGKILKQYEAERNEQQTKGVANKKAVIGENESDLDQKIEGAREKLASAEQELADRERIINKKVKEAAEDLFKGGVEKKGDLFGMEVDYSPENMDKMLEPYRGKVETAKRNLEVLEQPINREQARDIDRRQREIKFEQDVINNAVGEKNAEDIVDNMEENGDIKIECE